VLVVFVLVDFFSGNGGLDSLEESVRQALLYGYRHPHFGMSSLLYGRVLVIVYRTNHSVISEEEFDCLICLFRKIAI
jgi:hypothetical protein